MGFRNEGDEGIEEISIPARVDFSLPVGNLCDQFGWGSAMNILEAAIAQVDGLVKNMNDVVEMVETQDAANFADPSVVKMSLAQLAKGQLALGQHLSFLASAVQVVAMGLQIPEAVEIAS